ncbi:MAG: hypothetical protein BroJett018_34580 [Chloroflexota bacterium]|nr:cytochrome C [Chloroflexota bacterium]NOG64032.1 cytochrome C [Chloroflexota bacterium]GIK65664.1 MAG: hypothetical protein BroJett018_34580 [Chloroflexota bacterium]
MTTMTHSLNPSTTNTRAIWQKVLRAVPSVLLIVAAILILQSMSKPYWNMHLDAVQYEYRGGLDILVYVDRMAGRDPEFDELRELNSLNHYIGMRKLDDAAEFERSIAEISVYAFAVLLTLTAVGQFIQWRGRKFVWLLVLPPLSFPFVFLGDLYYWLRDSGQNLDRNAPFSSSIHPFTPPIWGEGKVGQFETIASLDTGWYMVFAASVCIVVALVWALIVARRGRSAVTTPPTPEGAK